MERQKIELQVDCLQRAKTAAGKAEPSRTAETDLFKVPDLSQCGSPEAAGLMQRLSQMASQMQQGLAEFRELQGQAQGMVNGVNSVGRDAGVHPAATATAAAATAADAGRERPAADTEPDIKRGKGEHGLPKAGADEPKEEGDTAMGS